MVENSVHRKMIYGKQKSSADSIPQKTEVIEKNNFWYFTASMRSVAQKRFVGMAAISSIVGYNLDTRYVAQSNRCYLRLLKSRDFILLPNRLKKITANNFWFLPRNFFIMDIKINYGNDYWFIRDSRDRTCPLW